VDAVDLFVNLPMRQVIESLELLAGVRTIQWHGESREVCETSPYELIRAFAVRDCTDLKGIQDYLDQCRSADMLPKAILVDAHVPGQHGGTGQTAPWSLIADFQPGVPLILAGGLTPENVAEAIRIVKPSGVDVASGVELAPGRKDSEKLRRFVAQAREAAAKWN
jgi:phosphoribosylanthranilate isomerase